MDHREEELLAFYSDLPQIPYVMEEFLSGDICTCYAIMEVNMRPALFLFLRFPDVSYKPDDFEKRSKCNVSNYDCRGSGQIHRRSRRDRSEFLCRYGKSRKTARCDHAAVP